MAGSAAIVSLLKGTARGAIDVLLPPRCLLCKEPVAGDVSLCAECWPKLDFIAPPLCRCCGYPFAFEPGGEALCGACMKDPPPWRHARAVLRYGDGSRDLVLAFKHADRTDAAPALGRWLARAGGEVLADADVIVPVPLHWIRLFRRRYNQAALLAQGLGRASGVATCLDGLERRRATPTQGRLSREGRLRNVAGAFRVKERRAALIRGRRVVLVDDVLTTGATASACAKALLRAGAASVDVLVVARVVRES